MQKFSFIAVVMGIFLVVGSFLLPMFVNGRSAWSEEQARSYSQAAAELHRRTLDAGAVQESIKRSSAQSDAQTAIAKQRLENAAARGGSIDPKTATADRLNAQLAAAKDRYDRERSAYNDARNHGQGAASVLYWLGIGLIAAGLFCMMPFRGQ